MKLLGFGLRGRAVLISITLAFSCLSFQSYMFGENQQPSEGVSAAPVIELLREVFTNFKNWDYFTTNKLIIPLSVVNQEIVVGLGDAGSGYLFDPFKTVTISVRTNPNATGAMAQDTASILTQALTKYVAFKGQEQLALLDWLKGSQVGSLKIFFIKLLLLTKYVFETKDFGVLQKELPCLMFKLSLDQDSNLLKSANLSAYVPDLLKQFMHLAVPSLLDIVDCMWSTFATRDSATTEAQLRSIRSMHNVQAFAFNSKEMAEKCFDTCKSFDPKTSKLSFVETVKKYVLSEGYQLLSSYDEFERSPFFYQFKKLVKPTEASMSPTENELVKRIKAMQKLSETLIVPVSWTMTGELANTKYTIPQDVITFLGTIKTFPSVQMFKSSNDTWWVAFVNDRLAMSQTIGLLTSTMMYLFKKYTEIRKEFLVKNEDEAQKQRDAYARREKETQKVKRFLKTEYGIASEKRLHDALSNVGLEKSPEMLALSEDITKVRAEVTEREETLVKEQKSLNTFRNLNSPSAKKLVGSKEKRVAQLTKDLEAQKQELKRLENDFAAKNPDTEIELRNKLVELKALEQQLRNQGDGDINPELVSAIKDLETKLASKKAVVVPLKIRLEAREKQATVYRQEKELIAQDMEKRQNDIDALLNSDEQRVERIKFTSFEKGSFQAYIKYLEQKAIAIEKENKDVLELEAYRLAQNQPDADISEPDGARRQELELTVGHILDNRAPSALLGNMAGSDTELKEFIVDLYGNKPEFKALKSLVSKTVTRIIRQSDHFQSQEAMIMYETVIRLFAPEFWPTFQQLTQQAQV